MNLASYSEQLWSRTYVRIVDTTSCSDIPINNFKHFVVTNHILKLRGERNFLYLYIPVFGLNTGMVRYYYTTKIYPFKAISRSSRKRCEICSKLTIKEPERLQWCRCGVFIVNFEYFLHLFLKCFYSSIFFLVQHGSI